MVIDALNVGRSYNVGFTCPVRSSRDRAGRRARRRVRDRDRARDRVGVGERWARLQRRLHLRNAATYPNPDPNPSRSRSPNPASIALTLTLPNP